MWEPESPFAVERFQHEAYEEVLEPETLLDEQETLDFETDLNSDPDAALDAEADESFEFETDLEDESLDDETLELENLGNSIEGFHDDEDSEAFWENESEQHEGPRLEGQASSVRSLFDRKLDEALTNLKPGGFGIATNYRGRWDTRYWYPVKDEDKRFGRMLVMKKPRQKDLPHIRKKASDIIAEAVKRSDCWTLECASFVQLAQLYAISQADSTFDSRWPNGGLKFRLHGSDEVKHRFRFWRKGKGAPWGYLTGKAGKSKWQKLPSRWTDIRVLAKAPRGSRAMWRDKTALPESAFRNENTVKIGNDRYRGFGFGTHQILTGMQVMLLLGATNLRRLNAERSAILAGASGASTAVKNHTRDNVYLKEVWTYRRP